MTNMYGMFYYALAFNQDISQWKVSKVTDMSCMFCGASSFNQPLNDWNVSNVSSTNGMFYNASSFNQPLNDWNVSNVINMEDMFYKASLFNPVYVAYWSKENQIKALTEKRYLERIEDNKKLLHSILNKKFKSNKRDISDIMEIIGSYL